MSLRRRWGRNATLLRYYARIAAVVAALTGLLGFTNTLGWAWLPNVYHLALGFIFGYVGFFMQHQESMRQIVAGMGGLMVTLKVINLLIIWLSGEAIVWGPLEVSCFVLGIASILAARYLRDGSPPRERQRERVR